MKVSAFEGIRLLPICAQHLVAAFEQLIGERTRLRLLPFRNSQRAHHRGLEITLQPCSANHLNGWISSAYGRATVCDGSLGLTFPADFDQRHTVSLRSRYS